MLNFDSENKVSLTSDEVLTFIEKEKKVEVLFDNGFKSNTDTEDVFRGLSGDRGFEENDDLQNALYECEFKHTFFLSNATKETPFNEIGMVKRIVKDNQWTSIILHDRPLKDGFYAMVVNNPVSKYDAVVKEYEDFKNELSKMYEKEREILSRLQKHCPHENTYRISNDSVYDDFIDEEEVKDKCRDCGKVI